MKLLDEFFKSALNTAKYAVKSEINSEVRKAVSSVSKEVKNGVKEKIKENTKEKKTRTIADSRPSELKDISREEAERVLNKRGAQENMEALKEQYDRTYGKTPETIEEFKEQPNQFGKLSALFSKEAILETDVMTDRAAFLEEDTEGNRKRHDAMKEKIRIAEKYFNDKENK